MASSHERFSTFSSFNFKTRHALSYLSNILTLSCRSPGFALSGQYISIEPGLDEVVSIVVITFQQLKRELISIQIR